MRAASVRALAIGRDRRVGVGWPPTRVPDRAAPREDILGIRFKNPWWVVGGAVMGLFVCNGPVLAFTFGVFLKPIMADLGAQRGTVSLVFGIGGVCSSLMVPVLGWMMDRWSIRQVALPGIVLYALATCLLGFTPHSLLIFTLL